MRVSKSVCLMWGIIFVSLVGCGGPPSTTPAPETVGLSNLSWETLDEYTFNVVESDAGLVIPAGDLYELLYFSRVAASGGPVYDSAIEFFRDSLLVDSLIGLTSADYDLSAHWYHYRDYRNRTDGALRQAFWDQEVSSQVTIDSQAVIDYYHQHPEKFTLPEQVDIYHILSSPLGFRQGADSSLVAHYGREELAYFAREYIERLYMLLMFGEAFENVAFNYSHDQMSLAEGGHIGWTTREKYFHPFDSVAFSLEDGEFSKPYQDGDGWHLLYRARYNPGGVQSIDTGWVYVQCQQSVFDETAGVMAGRILDSLYLENDVQVNERVLNDSILYHVDDSVWAAIVNQTDTIDALRLKGYEEDYRRGYGVTTTTPEMRRQMIEHAAMPIRVLQAARDLGIDTLPEQREIQSRVWLETVKALRIAELYSRDKWEPPDSLVAAYYQDHFDDYNPEDHIKAQQLIVADVELAHFLREQMNLGLDLEYLADYYGKDEGYDVKFEDLGLVKRSEVDPALYLALENTHANNMSRVTETKKGFHVAKVLDRKYQRPLEMVRSEIRSRLIEEHRWERWGEFRDRLFQENQVRFPGKLPPFELPRLSERNHPRVVSKPPYVGQ